MLRCLSGVTKITEHAVEGPSAAIAVANTTPISFMLSENARPRTSSFTLPTNKPFPPSDAMPAMVFAADPPAISCGPTSAGNSSPARNSSTRLITPLATLCLSRNASSTGAMTSTIALPIPATSYLAIVRVLSYNVGDDKGPIEEAADVRKRAQGARHDLRPRVRSRGDSLRPVHGHPFRGAPHRRGIWRCAAADTRLALG